MSRIDLGDNIKKPKTVPATVEGFYKRVDDKKTGRISASLADALEQHRRGELSKEEYKTMKTELKLGARFYTPHAHFLKGYKSSEGEPEDSGKAIIDLDGCAHFPQLYDEHLKGRERELGINMANISLSNTGGHILFDIPEGLTRQQAQRWMAEEILGGVEYDQAVHELERAIYIPCREYILYIDEELMFSDDLHPAKLSDEVVRKYTKDVSTSRKADEKIAEDIEAVEPSTRALAAFDATLEMTGLDLATLNRDGVRHNTLKLLLPTLCQMMTQEELFGVLALKMPEYSKEQDCRTLVTNFYDKYVDQNRPMNLKQKEVFLRSLKADDETKDNSEEPTVSNNTPQVEMNFDSLPSGLKESLKPYPKNMWWPLIVGQMPAMMSLADGVTFRYCDGKISYLGGMSIILGEQASNKSAIEEAIERWLVDLRREDDMVREREDKVREANKRRKANERAQETPAGVVRIVPITISCSKLLKRLKQSQGHCLYSVCTEAETLLKSNGSGAWAQKWDIYRNAFGRERWGVDFNSDQSESGDVQVAYNWTILGTPHTVLKMFKGKNESNAENGLSSRCMLSEMPDNLFAKITVFKELTEADMERVNMATETLRSASGFYDTPRLRKAINAWLEEKREEASMDMDTVKDRFRRRAGMIGFRCGVVFMLLAGKESKACLDFAVNMAEYTLQMQLKVFRPLLSRHYSGLDDDAPNNTPNGYVFARLPSPFNIQDLSKLKGDDLGRGALYTIISRWKSEGWIEKKGKSWIKKL